MTTTTLTNAALIGSRAWFFDFNDELYRDWDLVVTRRNFMDLLRQSRGLISGIVYDSIKDGKFKIYCFTPQVLEIEIEERYKSNKLLKYLQASPGITHMANLQSGYQLRLEPISRIACAVLKSSHIFFPINWRKNALQLAQMRDLLRDTSLKNLISKEKRKVELGQLFDVRSRETLARINLDAKSTVLVARNSEKLSAWDKSILTEFGPQNENDTDYFPTTDSRVSRAKFHSVSDEDRLRLIEDQLQLISSLYFNDSPSLSAQDIYLLSLETFCCQQVARKPTNTQHNLFRRTELVYHRKNYECKPDDKGYPNANGSISSWRLAEALANDIEKSLPKEEFELATQEQVEKSTLGNSVIQWLVDNWCSARLKPSQRFSEFVAKNIPVDGPLPILPLEIIYSIFDQTTNEHVTLLAIAAVNKEFHQVFNSDERWKALASKAWGKKAEDYYNTNVSPEPWRVFFRTLYDEATRGPVVFCHHCRLIHNALSEREEGPEWEMDYCPCPECDAQSYATCAYRQEYVSFY